MMLTLLLLAKVSVDGVRLALADAGYDTKPGYKDGSYTSGDSPCVFNAKIESETDFKRGVDKIKKVLDARGVVWLFMRCGPITDGIDAIGLKLNLTEPRDPYRAPGR